MAIKMVVDSGANIPAYVCKKYDIEVISFKNVSGDEEIVCYNPDATKEDERAAAREYYESVRAGKEYHTSMITMNDFEEAFERILKNGDDIIYFSISSGISGSCSAAQLTVNELRESYPDRKLAVIDALNASLGSGLLAIYGAEMAAEDKSFGFIVDNLRNMVPRMNGVFTVGNLKYLCKTGRVSKGAALIGNALELKPILRGDMTGHIVVFKKIRGRKKALKELAELVINNAENPEGQVLGIAHADAVEETNAFIDMIKSAVNFKDILVTEYDFCTGTHVGPDTVAVFFLAKDRELSK